MIFHYQTSKNENYYHKLVNDNFADKGLKLTIDRNQTYQEIRGFGGAFTEAAAYTFYQMPLEKRQEVLNAYFNLESGLGYNLGRVSIHSCDFSLNNYTYVKENDKELKTFSIERDLKYVIPMIKEAENIRRDKINILASPWSPPAWMKSNNDMNHGGKLLDEFKESWSEYYLKFLKAYKNESVYIFALTVQNEPAAKQVWDSCIYTAEEERDFVKEYLGPKLADSEFKDAKLLIWDHNRDILVERIKVVLEDEKANQYVWGIGYHWYVSEAFENLSKVHDLYPDKHLLFTEGTIENGVHLNQFHTGERYVRNMIGDFNNYCEGYIDWNLLLNEEGGPNHVGNFCDAPIIYDREKDIIHYNSSYYAIGHFSRHILPGAKRIDSNLDSEIIKHVTFMNPNGDIVVVIQNESESTEVISINTETKHNFEIKPHSISTIILQGEKI
ncbi:MAG: glycoside hydrolase family 30 protein [Tenericutes bacterium]|nr:glycoside hydrolase family 30 protein [Mycoplasmatota bacterium]